MGDQYAKIPHFYLMPQTGQLIPWRRMFGAISFPHFALVYDDLLFPVEPNEALRSIAHDFNVAARRLVGYEVTEPVTIDLLANIQPDSKWPKNQHILFRDTFRHLANLGYDDLIYKWALNTRNFTQTQLSDAYLCIQWLLQDWAVSTEQAMSPGRELTQQELDIYNKWRKRSIKVDIPLSHNTQSTLFLTLIDIEVRLQNLEKKVQMIYEETRSPWEAIVFHEFTINGGWISKEGKFQLTRHLWDRIVEMLSESELQDLENWALELQDETSGRRRGLQSPRHLED